MLTASATSPLACAIGLAATDVIIKEKLPQKAAKQGAYFKALLKSLKNPQIKEVRGKGLLLAIEFHHTNAHSLCERLMEAGILAKDTHDTTIRFAPPLIITKVQIDQAFAIIARVLGR